jgi:hypothetical protein
MDVADMKFIILIAVVLVGMFLSLYFVYANTQNKIKVILVTMFLILSVICIVVGLLFAIPSLGIIGIILFVFFIFELFSNKLDNMFTSDKNNTKLVLFFLFLILGIIIIFIGSLLLSPILLVIGHILVLLSSVEFLTDSLDTFFTQHSTKIVLLVLFFIMGIMAIIAGNFLDMFKTASYGMGILLLGLCIFELFSDKIDNFFINKGPHGNVKLVICSLLLLLGFGSMLAGKFFGMQFVALGVILLGMCVFEMFSDQLDSPSSNSKGIICVVSALVCVASVLATIKFPDLTKMLITVSVLGFLSFFLSLFDVPGFNSPLYVLLLFLLSNIPVVYVVVNRLMTSDENTDKMYIPLLIAFYVLSMVILYLLGSMDLSDNNSIFVIGGIIAVCLLYYMKSLPLSVNKTFFTLIGMILLFIVAVHYIINSSLWYVYLLVYALILFYMLKTTPLNILETIKRYVPQPKKKEAIFLGAEIAAILIYLYTRPVLQKIYVHDGKLLVNHPVHLQNEMHVTVDKNFKYTYSLSFWVYINQINPSSSPQATEFVPFLSYGDKPLFAYNSLRNIIRVQMKTDSKLVLVDDISHVKLQKWNHIVINQDNDTFDVFLNGELHKSTSHVVPDKETPALYIGADHGIDGHICNVMFFKKMLTTEKINNVYNNFKDKTPPTF